MGTPKLPSTKDLPLRAELRGLFFRDHIIMRLGCLRGHAHHASAAFPTSYRHATLCVDLPSLAYEVATHAAAVDTVASVSLG
jgi:hypothetical protein